MTSRREVIKALGAGAALPAVAADALAQRSAPALASSVETNGDFSRALAASDPFVAQFEEAWRPLDPQLRGVLRLIYARFKGLPPPTELSAADLRRINAQLGFYLNAGAPSVPHIEERTIPAPSGRIRIRLYDPGTPAPAPSVILLHGGGWVFGSIDTYDGLARQVAKRSGLRCMSVDYALAPEHPFPAPLEDCLAAIRWAVSDGASWGIDGKRVALIGDSAGANLALASCIALREAGSSPVRGAALCYGSYSVDTDTPSARAYGGGPYFLGKVEMERYLQDYLPTQADRKNPRAVPMLASLANLPPLYIAACEFDPLHDDSVRLAERAKAAGAEHELRIWKGMVHAAASLAGWVDAIGLELDRVGEFLRRVTARKE